MPAGPVQEREQVPARERGRAAALVQAAVRVPEPVIPEPVVPEPVIPEPVVPEPVIPEPGPGQRLPGQQEGAQPRGWWARPERSRSVSSWQLVAAGTGSPDIAEPPSACN